MVVFWLQVGKYREGMIMDISAIIGMGKALYEALRARKQKPNGAEQLLFEACVALEQLQTKNKDLKKAIETAISQHHRVRPNTVVDILIREYETLKQGE